MEDVAGSTLTFHPAVQLVVDLGVRPARSGPTEGGVIDERNRFLVETRVSPRAFSAGLTAFWISPSTRSRTSIASLDEERKTTYSETS